MSGQAVIFGGDAGMSAAITAHLQGHGIDARTVPAPDTPEAAAAALQSAERPELVIFVQVPPTGDSIATATPESWEANMTPGPRAALFVMQALAAVTPEQSNADAEPMAQAQIITILSEPRPRHRDHLASHTLASAALIRLTEMAGETLAPSLRANAIRLSAKAPKSLPDFLATLDYIRTNPALTGQVLAAPHP
jgi:hypothetical protein